MPEGDDSAANSLAALENLLNLLGQMVFKPLTRPHPRGSGRTEKEARWALRIYLSCSLSLFRDMLRGYTSQLTASKPMVAFLAARMLIELAAQMAYVIEKVVPSLKAEQYDEAWKLLEQANLGSIYMAKHGWGAKAARKEGLTTNPIQVETLLKSLDRSARKLLTKSYVFSDYSFFSEFSHPNAVAFRQYVTFNRQTMRAEFHAAEAKPELSVFSVSAYVALYIHFAKPVFEAAEMHTFSRLLDRAAHDLLSDRGNQNN